MPATIMIGMVFDDIIYFKTDDETRKAFRRPRSASPSPSRSAAPRSIVTTWFSLPDRLYDDPEELAAVGARRR